MPRINPGHGLSIGVVQVRHIYLESYGLGERASSQQATSTPITTRQIDPICAPPQMSVAKLITDHNGGSACGYQPGFT